MKNSNANPDRDGGDDPDTEQTIMRDRQFVQIPVRDEEVFLPPDFDETMVEIAAESRLVYATSTKSPGSNQWRIAYLSDSTPGEILERHYVQLAGRGIQSELSQDGRTLEILGPTLSGSIDVMFDGEQTLVSVQILK